LFRAFPFTTLQPSPPLFPPFLSGPYPRPATLNLRVRNKSTDVSFRLAPTYESEWIDGEEVIGCSSSTEDDARSSSRIFSLSFLSSWSWLSRSFLRSSGRGLMSSYPIAFVFFAPRPFFLVDFPYFRQVPTGSPPVPMALEVLPL